MDTHFLPSGSHPSIQTKQNKTKKNKSINQYPNIYIFQANAVKSEKNIAATTTSSEKAAVPAIQIETLKADLKAGVDDLKHPADIDHDALKLVMDFR